MDQNQTRTWSVSWYGKAMYQISNEYISESTKELRIRDTCIFPSPTTITSWKIDGSKPKSNFICILEWQSNVPNIKWISESTNEKSAENWEFVIFFKSNKVREKSNLELDLYLSMAKQCTKYQINIWKHEQQDVLWNTNAPVRGKLIVKTQGQDFKIYGSNIKVLSQVICICNTKCLSLTIQKIWPMANVKSFWKVGQTSRSQDQKFWYH
jgi:hypothetical protein